VSIVGFLVDHRFSSQVLLLQDVLTFHSAIALCYSQQFLALSSCVPSPKNCVVCEDALKVLFPIIIGYVLNQSSGHWLLPDALHIIISTC